MRGIKVGVRIAGGFATALGGVLLIGVLSWVQVSELLETMHWVDRTHEVLAQGSLVLEDVSDAESSMENYLLLVRDDLRAEFERDDDRFVVHLARLKDLVADDPRQAQRVAQLESLAKSRFDRAREQLDEVHRTGKAVTLEAKLAWAAELREELEQFLSVERQLLEERKAKAQETARSTQLSIALATLGLVVMLLVGTWLLSRSITRPLSQLVDSARRIERGEPARFPLLSGDELGELGQALEEMATVRQEAERRTRQLLDDGPEAYLLADAEGRCIDVNHATCALLGYSREELLEKRIVELVAPSEVADQEAVRRELMVPGSVKVYERRLLHQQGSVVPVEVSSKMIEGGRWQVFMRDLRARKQREAEQQFLARITAMLASSLDYRETLDTIAEELVGFMGDLCVVDMQQGEQLVREVVACGDPERAELAEQLRRFTPDRLQLARAWPGLQEHRSGLVAHMTPEALSVLSSDPAHRQVLEGLGLNSAMAVPMLSRGALYGCITLASEGSGRTYRQEDVLLVEEVARRAAIAIENARLFEKTQKAVRAREDVLHVVAHDLRNPLNAVGLQASTLVRRKGEERRLGVKRAVDAIKHSLAAANRLIEDLLDVARVENAGGLSLRTEPIAPAELVREAVELLSPAALNAKVSLESGAEGVPAELKVQVDRDRVVRVLSNLIGNALKFTPRDGRVRVALRVVETDLCISVTDTGPGIDAAELPHVFDRYWQADRKKGGGVGLGLAIAKSIVEEHGGRIWAESTAGAGATVSFTLPAPGGPRAEPERKG